MKISVLFSPIIFLIELGCWVCFAIEYSFAGVSVRSLSSFPLRNDNLVCIAAVSTRAVGFLIWAMLAWPGIDWDVTHTCVRLYAAFVRFLVYFKASLLSTWYRLPAACSIWQPWLPIVRWSIWAWRPICWPLQFWFRLKLSFPSVLLFPDSSSRA